MRRWGVFALLLLVSQGLWAMEVMFGAGSEYFQWQEYDGYGSELLTERGARHFLAFNTVNRVDGGLHADFGGRFYNGTVDYDGQYSDGTPARTEVDYNGMLLEVGFSLFEPARPQGLDGLIGLRLAAGGESWRRHLLGNGGYEESYLSSYARLGFTYLNDERFRFELGVKYPHSVREEVKGYYNYTVELRPEPKWSTYGSAAFALSRSWWCALRYDSYRFALSEEVAHMRQPESNMDTLGVSLQFHF